MAKGDGSIIRRGRDVWEVQVSFGRNPVTGRYEKASRTVHGTKAEARRVRDGMRREREGGLSVESARATFGEFAAQWLKVRESSGEVSRGTLAKDGQRVRLLCSYIGDVKLCDLSPVAVEALYMRIRADKMEELGRYSGTTLNQYHATLKRILKRAVDYDMLARNPCDRVDAPRISAPDKGSLTATEGARLLSFVDAELAREYAGEVENEARRERLGKNSGGRIYVRGLSRISDLLAVRLALMTGARRGELFGLAWECVDLERLTAHVRRSLSVTDGLKEPKTRAGNRRIAIDPETAAALEVWRIFQAAELAKLGIAQGGKTPVLCNDRGGFADLHHFERWWREFRDRAGVPGLTFHELRHTHATMLLGNGLDLKAVQSRLGHASAKVTLDMYAHALPENDRRAANLIARVLEVQESGGEQAS